MHSVRLSVLKLNNRHLQNTDKSIENSGIISEIHSANAFKASAADINPSPEAAEEDEAYDHAGGDINLYDSRIYSIDELKTLQMTLIHINKAHPELYNRIMSGIESMDQEKKFNEIMNGLDRLQALEANIERVIVNIDQFKCSSKSFIK